MKEKILLICFIFLFSVLSVISLSAIISDYTPKTPDENKSVLIGKYYQSHFKNNTEVYSYIITGKHVIINFKDTDTRVITSLKNFNKITKGGKNEFV